MKKLIVCILLVFISPTMAKYNQHNMVQGVFLKEQGITQQQMYNKCGGYSLADISYAFGQLESHNCQFGASIDSKNCWSLHPGGSKQFRHQAEGWGMKYYGPEPLNVYGRMTAANYDFMATYYYSYGCTIDYAHIKYYICGRADWCRGKAWDYLENLENILNI